MTREELTRMLCPSFMTSNCENQVDCNYCKEKMNKWLDKYDKQIIKEFVNEVDKYTCTNHAKCKDCDFTYKTCFECFYHTEWLKENK